MVHMVPGVPSRVCTHGGTAGDLAPYPKPQAQLVASSGAERQQAARNRRPPAGQARANGELRSVRVPVHMRCWRRAHKILKPPAEGLRLTRGGFPRGGRRIRGPFPSALLRFVPGFPYSKMDEEKLNRNPGLHVF